MEAARVSALRGHAVTLYEKSSKLGGLLPLAAMVKGNHPEDLSSMIRYLASQIAKLGVKVELGKEADLSVIEQIKPDVVFLAAGGIPTIPKIAGIENPKVLTGAMLHRKLKFFLRFFSPEALRWLSTLYMPIGKRVIVIGGAIQGCELAEFLTKRGRKVTIVDTKETMGEGMVDVLMSHLFMWFKKKGVTMISGVKEYVEITKKGLTIIGSDWKKQVIEADTIICALPFAPDTSLLKSLEGKVREVYAIGDCREPLLIADAIGAGTRTAREV
jgi:2,4-dienoyl-CoA reductase (NADPH2)